MGWPDADIMYVLFHSSQIGSLNFAFVEDTELDALLDTARNEIDDAAHQEAVNTAYKMIQEKSYMIPLYYPLSHYAISNDFQGVKSSPFTGFIFSDMYYTGE
jgi:peptide/nickel transport system substrate-binding protein